jgi:nucleoid-associated protein YgaU
MLLTDLNGPMSLKPRRTGLGRISRPIRFAAPAILFLSFALFGATISRAQDQQDQTVAEAARQERARKQESQKRAKHVYTEEDLKHPSILTPEDRAQIEAKRNECAQKNNCSPAPSQNPPATLDANAPASGTSLGEVARQLRKQKELQALKPKQSELFHLPFSTPALASPILPERPPIRPPSQPVLRPKTSSPKMPSNVFRRDPFSAVPVRPEVHAKVRKEILSSVRPDIHPDVSKDVRPTLRAPVRSIPPALPRISSRPATPNILIQPKRPLPSAAMATPHTISVQPGDSLWKLAQQNLGRGNRWPQLLASNPWIADPNQIRAGAHLNLPAVAATAVSSHGANAAATIKVRKGDTLWTLAKSGLGRFSAWPCLAAANPSLVDPNRIYRGQLLVVPSACRSMRSNPSSRASP